jgi:hypothetical protein
MRPLLRDVLATASGHIGAATGDLCLEADAAPSVVRELVRLTAVMSRCADAFVQADRGDSRHLLDAHGLAMLDAGSALRHAYACMRAAWGALGGGSGAAQHAAAACLSAAADGLAAGHDLLQTHFTTDQSGWRHGKSPWAPAIVSPPVSAALITEIGGYAGRLAPWALQLAAAVPEGRLPARARVAIGAGCRWLWVAEAAARVVRYDPGASAGQPLLHSIPVNLPPVRYPPRGGEPVPQLCAGTAITAERLGHLAYITATRGYPPRAALATCWQRTAQAAAIAGHCSELILRQLAEPAARLPHSAAAETAIKQAAQATCSSWQAWRAVARQWDIFTTGPGTIFTPVAAEIGDLILWIGRLAHADPAWSPARNHSSPLRPGTGFIDGDTEISAVVIALHYASDALTRIVGHDREGVRSAAATEDLYVPTRLLPADNDVPYRYVPTPSGMLDELLATYDAVAEAAMRAASTLDRLVLTLNSQPTALTALRAVAPLNTPCPPHSPAVLAAPPTKQPPPGQVEQALRGQGISEPALLARAAELDDKTTTLISSAASISQRRAQASGAVKHACEASPTGRQHPARLAAKDSSPATGAATSLPRLVPISHQIRHSTQARRRPNQ